MARQERACPSPTAQVHDHQRLETAESWCTRPEAEQSVRRQRRVAPKLYSSNGQRVDGLAAKRLSLSVRRVGDPYRSAPLAAASPSNPGKPRARGLGLWKVDPRPNGSSREASLNCRSPSSTAEQLAGPMILSATASVSWSHLTSRVDHGVVRVTRITCQSINDWPVWSCSMNLTVPIALGRGIERPPRRAVSPGEPGDAAEALQAMERAAPCTEPCRTGPIRAPWCSRATPRAQASKPGSR